MDKRNIHKEAFFRIKLDIFVCLFLALATVIPYLQVLDHEFVNYDDPMFVTENRHVQAGINLKSIVFIFTNPHPSVCKLALLSHMLDCEFFGLDSGLHHLTNLLFHIANTMLLFLCFKRMTGERWRSAFIAAIFALHPLNVESVAWVSDRKNVLSTFFWILTMLAYARYAERPSLTRYLAVLLSFGLGLMAKPMLVTLPFVLLLLDYWPLCRFPLTQSHNAPGLTSHLTNIPQYPERNVFRLILEKIPLIALTVIAILLVFFVIRGFGHIQTLETFPLGRRIAYALVSYVAYISKMIWPHDLAPFYPLPRTLPGWQVAGAGILLISITVLVLRTVKQRPYLAVGWLWYVGTLVPVIGIVRIGSQPIADRYTYVPLIGMFIIFAWGIPEIVARWRHRTTGLVTITSALLLIFIVTTWLQTRYWSNSITLFEHALESTVDNYVAHTNLGIALKEQGRTAEAISHYTEVLRINPIYAEGYNNMGNALILQGKIDEAIEHFSEALRLNPDYVKAHNNLGNALLAHGRTDEAIDHFSKALDLSPDYPEIHYNLGAALFRLERIQEAIGHFREALRLRPDFVQAHLAIKFAIEAQKKNR